MDRAAADFTPAAVAALAAFPITPGRLTWKPREISARGAMPNVSQSPAGAGSDAGPSAA